MFLKAGVLSLALLLASRLLGLLRESAQAAAFGASGAGDVATLVLTLLTIRGESPPIDLTSSITLPTPTY